MYEGLKSVRWSLGERRWEHALPMQTAGRKWERCCAPWGPSAGKCGQIACCFAVSCCGSEALGWSPGEDGVPPPGDMVFASGSSPPTPNGDRTV